MSIPIAVDADGQAFTAFECAPEIIGAEHRGVPCPLALVVIEAEDQVLFGLNRWRRSWELPGGMLEEGESPRQAARRELLEETGVALPDDDLVWIGLATFKLVDPPRAELAAVFVAKLDSQPPSTRTEELEEVGWFRLDAPLSTHAPLDLAVARTALWRSI